MAETMSEASPLITKPGPNMEAQMSGKKNHEVSVRELEQGTQPEWDGNLLNVCGSCDQNGFSAFAYVKLLSPLAWGHNLQRALGLSFWKHAIVFTLLFLAWGWVFVADSSRVGVACGPRIPPHDIHHGPQPLEPLPGQPAHPQGQQFLTGATLNPQLVKENLKDDGSAEWVNVEGIDELLEDVAPSTEAAENEDQLVLNQIQTAKAQAAEGVAQLGAGRKLLHKHKHDDDDDDEHKHNGDEHKKKGEHKEGKKGHKKGKHGKGGKGKPDGRGPSDKMVDGPRHGPESPECLDAQVHLGLVSVIMVGTAIIGIMYASMMRTAIRKRFGIKGSKCQDCMAWTFCMPCALCQETRTLAKNNVHAGVWYGPTVLTAAPAEPLKAPQPVEAPTKPV